MTPPDKTSEAIVIIRDWQTTLEQRPSLKSAIETLIQAATTPNEQVIGIWPYKGYSVDHWYCEATRLANINTDTVTISRESFERVRDSMAHIQMYIMARGWSHNEAGKVKDFCEALSLLNPEGKV